MISGILLARGLGAESRGYLALIVLVPTILTQIGLVGLPTATSYFVAQGVARDHVLSLLFRPILAQVLGSSVVLVLVLLWLQLGAQPGFFIAGIATLPGVGGAIVGYYGLAVIQGGQFYKVFNLLRIVPTAANAVAVVVLYTSHELSLKTAAFAWSVSMLALAVLTIAAVRVTGSGSVAPSTRALRLGELVTFGMKAFVGSLYPIETFRLDQLLVGLIFTPVALGYYVVGLAFTNLLTFVNQSLGMVAYPAIASTADARRQRRLLWNFVWFSLGLSSLAVGAIEIALGWLVPLLYGSDFLPAISLARVLLAAVLVRGVRRILSDSLKGAGAPTAGTIAEVVSWVAALLFLGLFALLDTGPLGVAAAVACSECASVGALLILEHRLRRKAANEIISRPSPTDTDGAIIGADTPTGVG